MHAVVFSGGGAKGVLQAKEFLAQLKEGLPPPDIVYGTSVGAINAAGYAYNGLRLGDLWRSIRSKSDVMSLNILSFWRAFGVYNTAPLKKLLKQHIQGKPICRAVACHVDLVTRQTIYVYNDRVPLDEYITAVQASASIPFAMEPVITQVDGGVREVTPLYQAIREGADEITVFLCNPYESDPAPDQWKMPSGFFPTLKVGVRALDIMQNEIFVNDIEKCLFYNKIPSKKKIKLNVFCPKPEDMVIDTLEFDSKKIRSVLDSDFRMENALFKANARVQKKIA
jgi:NTE family protein